ncbi:MAG: hypothetical protein NW220_10545 [Leptolyngbyaceae cyanobacterium bins.349]|nr:hypothetical protein [Leptolyngbyaceae cyanobacterium bins.349]
MTPEQEQAIADLRSRNVAPKQIARQLGLRPAEVSACLKAQAEQATATRLAAGELNPVYQCLVNQNCLAELTTTPPETAPESDNELATTELATTDDNEDVNSPGFAIVTVARKAGFNRVEVCTYLVDVWCLGVKDVSGMRTVDPTTYRDFVDFAYKEFAEGTAEISLEMAQAIVLGGIEYAAKLGLQPHRDFAAVRSHLGTWSGEPKLNFGKNGKPFYMSGPYDDSMKILKTLRETVGEGNFEFIVGVEEPW